MGHVLTDGSPCSSFRCKLGMAVHGIEVFVSLAVVMMGMVIILVAAFNWWMFAIFNYTAVEYIEQVVCPCSCCRFGMAVLHTRTHGARTFPLIEQKPKFSFFRNRLARRAWYALVLVRCPHAVRQRSVE